MKAIFLQDLQYLHLGHAHTTPEKFETQLYFYG